MKTITVLLLVACSSVLNSERAREQFHDSGLFTLNLKYK